MKRILLAVLLSALWAAPAAASDYGPSPSITCPVGAVTVATTDDLQTKINANGTSTDFCLAAGVHVITSAATPKTGDTFTGEYGAILDGSTWTTSDTTQGAFRAHNQDVDNVTISNLIIRNMPQRAIHVLYGLPSGWTVEYTEIHHNKTGLEMGATNAVVQYNWIHDNISATPDDPTPANRGGAYSGYRGTGMTFDHNEIGPGNGSESKMVGTTDVTFSNNYVHNNYRDGIWFDGDNTGVLIDSNTVDDNGRNGIFYEISTTGTIQNNTVRRSADSGIFISASQNLTVTGNTLVDNYRGVNMFIDCGRVSSTHDLKNNTATDNAITVPSTTYAYGSGLSWTNCTSTQYTAYLNGSKNLAFVSNDYSVPSTSGKYWVWGFNTFVTWSTWQGIPQDTAGTLNQPCTFTVGPTTVYPTSAGGTQSLTVTASGGSCAWTAATGDSWLSVGTASGTGSGSSLITISSNGSSDPRTGTVLIATKAVTFTQAGNTAPSAPSAPTSLKIPAPSIGTDHLALTWADTSSDEDNFEVYQSTDNSTFALASTTLANVTTVNITGLASNTVYYFKVRAVNTGGASTYSNTASARTATPISLTLSVTPTSDRKFYYANLLWTPSAAVDVYRDDVLIVTLPDQAYYVDRLRKRGRTTPSPVYKVCQTGTANCSNAVPVTF